MEWRLGNLGGWGWVCAGWISPCAFRLFSKLIKGDSGKLGKIRMLRTNRAFKVGTYGRLFSFLIAPTISGEWDDQAGLTKNAPNLIFFCGHAVEYKIIIISWNDVAFIWISIRKAIQLNIVDLLTLNLIYIHTLVKIGDQLCTFGS